MLGVALICLWPLVVIGHPSNTDDIHWHAAYASQFLHEMISGSLYPRWLHGMNNGVGAPSFFFYGPLPYWLTSAIGLMSGVRDGTVLVAVGAVLLLLASGLSAYAWLRLLVPAWPAALGAALYVVAPYHLVVDLWTRSAFAEFAAYAWLPLVFRQIEALRAGGRRSELWLAVAFAGLAATHIVSALLLSCVLAPYVLVRLPTMFLRGRAALGLALGAALAGVYLFPALGMRGLVRLPGGAWSDSFLVLTPTPPPARGGLLHALDGIFVADLILCGAVGGVAARIMPIGTAGDKAGAERRLLLLWCAISACTLLATTVLAAPIWHLFKPLQVVVFPFRFMMVSDLGLATCMALLAARLRELRPRLLRPPVWRGALCGLAAVGGLQAVLPIAAGHFRGQSHAFETRINADGGDFRPLQSVDRLPWDAGAQAAAVPVPVAEAVTGGVHISVVARGPRRYVVAVDANVPATIRLGQLYFPGWEAVSGGVRLPLRASAALGIIEMDVPAGRHEVVVALPFEPLEWAGLAVSGVACVLWVLAFLWRGRDRTAVGS